MKKSQAPTAQILVIFIPIRQMKMTDLTPFPDTMHEFSSCKISLLSRSEDEDISEDE